MTRYQKLSSRMRKRYGAPIGCGASRRAFRYRNWVVKIPINECGIFDNKREAQIYADYRSGNKPFFVPAICKLLIDKETGLPILFMERLVIMRRGKTAGLPDWAHHLADGASDFFQVGKSKNGEIKCYDYAMES